MVADRKQAIAVGLILFLGIALGYFFGYDHGFEKGVDRTITSFEGCVAAGNAVMESYPRQCRTADGQLFIEDIEDGVVCTADAKQCPDGSYVGRVGPNCEFTACPGE